MKHVKNMVLMVALLCFEKMVSRDYLKPSENNTFVAQDLNNVKFDSSYSANDNTTSNSLIDDATFLTEYNTKEVEPLLSNSDQVSTEHLVTSPLNVEEQAERLITQAYVTPEMQWTILSFYKRPFVIDLTTRMPVLYELKNNSFERQVTNDPLQFMPTIEDIVDAVVLANLSPASKDVTVKALKTALNAVNAAIFLASVQASYDIKQQNYYFYQTAERDLIGALSKKAQKVSDALELIESQPITPEGSYPFWSYNAVNLDNKNHIMLNADGIAMITEQNNFKTLLEKGDNLSLYQAADLLVRQCYIAQDAYRSDRIQIQQNRVVDIYRHYHTFTQLITRAKDKPKLSEKNLALKQIRQAVQTALFIAKQELNYTQYNKMLPDLQTMDNQVKTWILMKEYGVTKEDQNRASMWSNLTNIAIGVGVTAAAGAAVFGYNNPKTINEMYNNFIQPTISSAEKFIQSTKTSFSDLLTGEKAKTEKRAEELYGIYTMGS